MSDPLPPTNGLTHLWVTLSDDGYVVMQNAEQVAGPFANFDLAKSAVLRRAAEIGKKVPLSDG